MVAYLKMLLSFHHTVLLLVVHSFVSLQERHVTPRRRVLQVARVVDQLENLDQFVRTGLWSLRLSTAAQSFLLEQHPGNCGENTTVSQARLYPQLRKIGVSTRPYFSGNSRNLNNIQHLQARKTRICPGNLKEISWKISQEFWGIS